MRVSSSKKPFLALLPALALAEPHANIDMSALALAEPHANIDMSVPLTPKPLKVKDWI